MTEAEYGGWISNGTAGTMAGRRPPEAREPEARGTGRAWSGAEQLNWCKAGAKEASSYNKGRKKDGVAAILGVADE